ncbi:response regulator [Paenibacillus sp. FSL E2-8871]|uniref:response regulator transcription factor n=1 Tax=Paenibacillus sp. FSL E2-8871 TaxID=2975326 RepID=UPI0030FA0853
MLRIAIVDDEILIREGLARMISKENTEFLVIGTYSDGKHLLDELPSLQLDVVITDIRMPQINGLELIKQLKASHPQIRSILMSGFVEFNYAREAIRSSAVDYLLKPIDKEQLFELLYQLEEEQQFSRDKEVRHRSGLLLTLLQGDEPPSPLLLSSLTLPQPYFSVFVFKGRSREPVCFCVDRLRQEMAFSIDSLEIQNGLHVCILYSSKQLSDSDRNEIGDRIRISANGMILHVGTSSSYNDTAKLRQAYLDAKLACSVGIYNPDRLHYANIQNIQQPEIKILEPFNAIKEPLIHDLQILNMEGALEHVHNLFSVLKSLQAAPDQILRVCRWIVESAQNELQEFEALYKGAPYLGLDESIASSMSFSEIERSFTNHFSSILFEIRAHRLEMSGTAVETIKRWISANYNQHADLNTLANMVFLTPSYLSKLFKQETGLTLTDYITEIRLRKAKHLLKNAPDLKIHEIGAEVGYSDPAYFNKLFKRVVGVTPNEYKRISIV